MENQTEIKKMSRKIYFVAIGAAAVLTLFIIAGTSKLQQTHGYNFTGSSTDNFKIRSPEIPSKLNFAGEKVPLNNFEVKERIDRELIVNTFWFSSTILGMKRAIH